MLRELCVKNITWIHSSITSSSLFSKIYLRRHHLHFTSLITTNDFTPLHTLNNRATSTRKCSLWLRAVTLTSSVLPDLLHPQTERTEEAEEEVEEKCWISVTTTTKRQQLKRKRILRLDTTLSSAKTEEKRWWLSLSFPLPRYSPPLSLYFSRPRTRSRRK